MVGPLDGSVSPKSYMTLDWIFLSIIVAETPYSIKELHEERALEEWAC